MPKDYSYVEKRRAYKQEVGNLRRAFIFEHKKRVEQREKQQKEERERIEKEKQARLVIKRELKARRLEIFQREQQLQQEAQA